MFYVSPKWITIRIILKILIQPFQASTIRLSPGWSPFFYSFYYILLILYIIFTLKFSFIRLNIYLDIFNTILDWYILINFKFILSIF